MYILLGNHAAGKSAQPTQNQSSAILATTANDRPPSTADIRYRRMLLI